MMKFGDKKKLAWDMLWNMKPVVIITVHSRLILLEKKAYTSCFSESLPAISLFIFSSVHAQLQ